MKKISTLLIFVLMLGLVSMTSDKEPYEIYSLKGKESSYEKMLDMAEDADVVFFGESHDNPISHWFEYELALDLAKEKGQNLIMGAEMFEADQQELLNEYLTKIITKKQFEEQARLWKNHATDYANLLQVAVDNKLNFVATNVPRRYAAIVNSKGFGILDTLSPQAKQWIAPLPIEYDASLPGYKKMIEMASGHGMKNADNLPKAQAVKDATMAYFIAKNYKKGSTFLHFNGSYHSENFEGIIWYLKKLKPELKIVTITTVEQDNIEKLDSANTNLADFIIVTNSNFPKSY